MIIVVVVVVVAVVWLFLSGEKRFEVEIQGTHIDQAR